MQDINAVIDTRGGWEKRRVTVASLYATAESIIMQQPPAKDSDLDPAVSGSQRLSAPVNFLWKAATGDKKVALRLRELAHVRASSEGDYYRRHAVRIELADQPPGSRILFDLCSHMISDWEGRQLSAQKEDFPYELTNNIREILIVMTEHFGITYPTRDWDDN